MVVSLSTKAAQAFVVAPASVSRGTAMSTGTRQRSSTPLGMVSTGSGAEYTANLPGAPFGMAANGKYFDPAGLATNQDPKVVKKWREAELKHGRVAMLAALGVLVAEVSEG